MFTFFFCVNKKDVIVWFLCIHKMELGLEFVYLSGLYQPLVCHILEVLSLHQLELLWSALFFFWCVNVLTVLHAGPDHVVVKLVRVPVQGSLVEHLQGILFLIKVPVRNISVNLTSNVY